MFGTLIGLVNLLFGDVQALAQVVFEILDKVDDRSSLLESRGLHSILDTVSDRLTSPLIRRLFFLLFFSIGRRRCQERRGGHSQEDRGILFNAKLLLQAFGAIAITITRIEERRSGFGDVLIESKRERERERVGRESGKGRRSHLSRRLHRLLPR